MTKIRPAYGLKQLENRLWSETVWDQPTVQNRLNQAYGPKKGEPMIQNGLGPEYSPKWAETSQWSKTCSEQVMVENSLRPAYSPEQGEPSWTKFIVQNRLNLWFKMGWDKNT